MKRPLTGLALAILLTGCVNIDKQRADIDAAMYASVATDYGPPTEDARVIDIGARLSPHAPPSDQGPDTWTYVILDDDDVQAFTTIDGTIVLTRALVDRLETDDELGAEIARQMAHARFQHLWVFMNTQISSAGFFIWPKGAATGLDDAKVDYASWLFHREGVGFMHPFQAWQLIEADAAAAGMLTAAGFDPAGIEGPLRLSTEDTQYAETYNHVRERRKALKP